MKILLLGPVEVSSNGEAVALGGPKERALLALLAVRAGAAVSADELIDGLWGDEPPASAPKLVQLYVSHLRKALASVGEREAIVTHGRGYELRVGREQVDVGRFERLLAQGAARKALALWRGRPLADIDGEPFAVGEVRRLQEMRTVALELAIDQDLQAGRHREVLAEIEGVLAQEPLRERLHALRMLALYRSGRQAEALEAYREARAVLIEEVGIEPGPQLRHMQEAILRQDPSLHPHLDADVPTREEALERLGAAAGRAAAGRAGWRIAEDDVAAGVVELQALRERDAAEPTWSGSPFRGLAAFDIEDAGVFFGRERLVAELVARVPGSRLMGIVGPSGSGKSSVLRAGLLAALADGVLPGSEDWPRVIVRPGGHPLQALDELPRDGRCVLAVDQFEETFTLCGDEAERRRFVEALLRCARDPHRAILVILAIRADYYGRCATYPELSRALGVNHALVGPMHREELRRAIELPARRAGLPLEPALADTLVDDVAGEPGGLPLLSTALLELSEDELTLAAYQRSGGVHGAVARLAEGAYERLDPDDRERARRILLRLSGDGNARARVPIADLDASDVLDTLAGERLVTLGDGEAELAHEALLREWPRLRGWLEEDAEGRRLHRHLAQSAREWDQAGHDPAELYRGARLASALDFASERGDLLNELERKFLDEARLVSEREAERSRGMNRRLRALLAAALIALVIAGLAGAVALQQRTDAREAATVADAQRLGAQALTDDRLDRALLLARAGVELHDSVATRGNLLATLMRVRAGSLGVLPDVRDVEIYSVAVNPRGDRLAFGDAFGDLQVFDIATRRKLASHRLDPGLVQRVAFSPDGATLAVTSLETVEPPATVLLLFEADSLRQRLRVVLPPLPEPVEFMGASPVFTADGNVAVLQIPFPQQQPEAVRLVDARTGAIARRAFRFDGTALDPVTTRDRRRVLVTSDRDDATYELDAADLRLVARHPAGGIAQALHPDDRILALGGGDSGIRLLDLRTSRIRRLTGRQAGTVTRMRFTPDGTTLASVNENGELLVWDTAAGTLRERFAAHTESAEALAFTPDGQTAISAGADGRVALWNLAGSRLIRSVPLRKPFDVDDFTPRGVAISPDDRTLAVTHADGTVDLVDTDTLRRRDVLRVGERAALGVDFSPDGRLLAVTGEGGLVGLWDASTLAPVGRLSGLRLWAQAVAFSPDGRLLAAGDVNGEGAVLRIWDVRRRTATSFRSELPASAVAFDPDGRLLAAAGMDKGVEIRDVGTGRLVVHLRTGELARSVAFSPDGRLLFAGLLNGAGQLYSTRDWRPVGARIRGQDQRLLHARFTPDGRTLATSSADGTVMLWDVASRKPVGAPVAVERDSYVAAAMSRDGAHLYAVAASTKGIRLALSPTEWKRQACAIAGRELTRREWGDALPGRSYRPICGGG